MKKLMVMVTLVGICHISRAQIFLANDSVLTGFQNTQMVFYKFSNGMKTVRDNTNWHLAFSVRPTQFPNAPLGGTTIRINEANGVKAIYVPTAKASDFSSLDTTGYSAWSKLHDSDTSYDFGALNRNKNNANIFDFGWGVYNSASHHVVGDSLYLIQLPNGSIKKLWVEKLLYDTAFLVQYSNIDNSDLQTLTINKKQYSGKNFVYLNMYNGQVEDKEPLSASWDILFLKYAASDVNANSYVSTTGVWSNLNVSVAKATGADAFSNNFSNLNFSTNLNAIGWDWKYFRYQNALTFKDVPESSPFESFVVIDSLAYFVKAANNNVYKLVFNSFETSGSGKIRFHVENLNFASGISALEESKTPSLYPNPAINELNIASEIEGASFYKVFDLSGKLLNEFEATGKTTTLNTSQFNSGVYILQTLHQGYMSSQKFVIAR